MSDIMRGNRFHFNGKVSGTQADIDRMELGLDTGWRSSVSHSTRTGFNVRFLPLPHFKLYNFGSSILLLKHGQLAILLMEHVRTSHSLLKHWRWTQHLGLQCRCSLDSNQLVIC